MSILGSTWLSALSAPWSGRALPWTRRIAGVLAVSLVVSAAQVPAAPAVAAPQLACPVEQPDEAVALAAAQACGDRVLITDATSETTQAWALPSGQVERQTHTAPVRIRKGASWVPVDLTLTRQADGSVAPVAHPLDLSLSGAATTMGERELAGVGTGDDRVAMGWTGELPEPALDGNRATYAEVRPGVDLVMEATLGGVESFYVVKNRAAAKQVASLTVPVTGRTVTAHRRGTDGDLTLLNAHGETVATSPAPLMWDAQTNPQSGEPSRVRVVTSKAAARKARKVGRGAAAIDGAGAQLTLTPDMSFFTDPATVYPVTVDPQLNPFTTWGDAYIKESTSSDHGGANDLQIGMVSGARTRSLITWDTSGLRGKQITSATVYLYNWWSPSCSAYSWDTWTTGAFDGTVTWANPPTWRYKEASSTGTRGYSSSCGDGWVSVSGTSFFSRAASEQQAKGYMGIRATSETDGKAFKQFRSRNAADASQVPYAVINYNSYPSIGVRSTVPPTGCPATGSLPFINTTRPLLRAVASDAEGSAVKAEFQWLTAAGALIGSATTAVAPTGSTLSLTVPAGALTDGGSYSWRARAFDGTSWSQYGPSCGFVVDTSAPSTTPTVTSSVYPDGVWAGGANTAASFTLGSGGVSDVGAFLYGLDDDEPSQVVTLPNPGGSATVSVTPDAEGRHALYVRSRDRAGNLSAVTVYNVFVGAQASPAPTAPDEEPLALDTDDDPSFALDLDSVQEAQREKTNSEISVIDEVGSADAQAFAAQASPPAIWGACGGFTDKHKVVRTYDRTGVSGMARGLSRIKCGSQDTSSPNGKGWGYRHIKFRHQRDWERIAIFNRVNWRDAADWATWTALMYPETSTYRASNDTYALTVHIYLRDYRNSSIVAKAKVTVVVASQSKNIITSYPGNLIRL